jgi:serine/threonine protein kinase
MGPSPRAATSARPLELGRYRVIEELSRAAGSVVYKARDPLIDRLVIIKTLAVGLPNDEGLEYRKRVDRELKSAGRLSHPNLVTIYDVGVTDDIVYIATEFIDGRSLRDMLRSGVRLMPSRAAEIAAQIADGLDFVHKRGLVHRNICPDTVMVLRNGVVKITDFGIARPSRGSHTMIADLVASPRYTSTEQVTGEKVDERSDIFSLGAVLYEMLTGVPPFTGRRMHEVAHEVVNAIPPPPSKCTRGVAPAFDVIVDKALAKDADLRYRTARDMAAELRIVANPDGVRPSQSPAPDAQAWPRRSSFLYIGVLLVALAAVTLNWPRSPTLQTGRAPMPVAVDHDDSAATIVQDPGPSATVPSEVESTASPAESHPLKESSVPATANFARLTLAIRPWGVVYVNGKKKGLSPPLKELALPPGTYAVEVRNDKFEAYRQSIELRAGVAAKVTHTFNDAANASAKDAEAKPSAAPSRTPLLSEEWPR